MGRTDISNPAGGDPDSHVGKRAVIVDDEVEVAKRRIILGVMKRDVAPQAKVQVADIREKGHQLQGGIQASAGRGMGLAPMGMYHELDVDAVAAHDIKACWLADNETFRRLG